MASMRCSSCTLRALRILVRSAGAESPNPFRSTPFHLRSSRSFAISQDPFRRHTSSLAAESAKNSELVVDATPKTDEPLNFIPEDANDSVATRRGHQSTSLPATNLTDEANPHENNSQKQKTERRGKRTTEASEQEQNVEHIAQTPSATGKNSGKEKVRTSSRNARREAARRGLTYEEFQEQDPEHPANIRARRGEIKNAEAQVPKEVTKTRRKQASGDKTRLERPKKREEWQIQKAALEEKFQEGWNPQKRLSPDALEGIRGLHLHDPEKFSTDMLSEYFKVSPEAIRRILRTKWKPSGEESDDRMRRWNKRGEKIWERYVALGVRPPKKWREMGVGKAVQGEAEAWKKHKRAVQLSRAESRLADEFERLAESDSGPSVEQSFADRIL